MPPPPASLHCLQVNLTWLCLQIPLPPQSLHRLFSRPCSHLRTVPFHIRHCLGSRPLIKVKSLFCAGLKPCSNIIWACACTLRVGHGPDHILSMQLLMPRIKKYVHHDCGKTSRAVDRGEQCGRTWRAVCASLALTGPRRPPAAPHFQGTHPSRPPRLFGACVWPPPTRPRGPHQHLPAAAAVAAAGAADVPGAPAGALALHLRPS